MTDQTDEFFDAALAGIQDRLVDLVTQPRPEGDPPDSWSKSLSALLKAKADTLAQREKEQAKIIAKHHTRYEDMPPPTPEDEARFHARFESIMRDIQSARDRSAGKSNGG